jgi:hypothetical protein
MRRLSSKLLLILILVPASLAQQQANVSVSARSGLPNDRRPFGKYLVETCSLAGEHLTLTCTKVPYPTELLDQQRHLGAQRPCPPTRNPRPCQMAAVQLKDQTVTIKLVCDPAKKDVPCDPTDPQVGADFFVSATADSGLAAQQAVLLGNATPLGGSRTVHYRANAIGPIVIRATAPEVRCKPGQDIQACDYAAAPPVDLILQAKGEADKNSCPVLPPSAGSVSKPLDAPTIVSLLGNPTPFILSAQGPNTILIYTTRIRPEGNERLILGSFQQAIAELAGRTTASLGITPISAKPFSVELRIPHWSALGDLATRINGLNYSQFTVKDVGRGSVQVTAPTQPDCDTWESFLSDIREMAWQLTPAPMSEKLYYLSSSDVATAFSGLGSPSASSASAGGSSSTATSSPGSSASTGAGSASGGTTASPPATASSASGASANSAATPASSAGSPNATIAITQPAGSNIQISSDTTPCVVAGLAFGNPTGCGSTPASASSTASATTSTAAAPAAPTPLAMTSVAVAAGTGEQNPPDLLVYSDANPGDDAQIVERNRILAQLDLPRPEMILSAWVTQNSTASSQAMGAFNNMVKGLVADYNHQYENVMFNGWISLKKQQAADPHFFNEPFRSYISDRFVADTNEKAQAGRTVQELSQAFLDHSQAKMVDPAKRTSLGICDRGRYCLGYNGLFKRASGTDDADNPSPIRPTITDLLLAIIAAQHPVAVALNAIKDVEGDAEPVPPCGECACDSEQWSQVETTCDSTIGSCQKEDVQRKERMMRAETRKRCHAIWHNLDLDHVSPPPQAPNCQELDFRGILGSLLDPATHEPRVHLQCFKQVAETLLVPAICEAGDGACEGARYQMAMPLTPAACAPADKTCKQNQLKTLSDEDAETLLTLGTEVQLKMWEEQLTTGLLPRVKCRSTDNTCQRAEDRLHGLQKQEAETLLSSGECQPGDEVCEAAKKQLEHSEKEQADILFARAKCELKDRDCETAKKQLARLQLTRANRANAPYGVGLFRAAIADFLFNYKMSVQYPHEFVPYDLTQSANTLNNAFSPLIDAFNRDLWSYQMFVRADMQYQVEELNSRTDERCCVKRLFGLDKPSFFNDGLVTVRTISGQPTNVSVTSQSFLNGSTAPELSSLLSSLASLGASGGGGGGASTSTTSGTTTTTTTTTTTGAPSTPGASAPPVTGLFGKYAALPAVLANYQTSYVQIGRQLSFIATPRSLATASSAEIAVTLNADESAGGPLYTGPGQSDPAFNTSRVANHDTMTRVRVDSIKLFEVSSFSAIVERSRSRFPLLPPFVEIPYIGTFAGIPLGSAKEFHSSTAIISAYVVPTAADIAYGLHFVSDLVVDGPKPGPCSFFKGAAGPDVQNTCVFRNMLSLHDVHAQPIHEFNRNIVRCFATDTSSDGCRRVSFENSLESR